LGKGTRDENFPVASRLIAPRHRKPILAFYEFVRVADDIADHATLAPPEKLALLDRLEANLLGHGDDDAVAISPRCAEQYPCRARVNSARDGKTRARRISGSAP
jgi:hydroxysqualene synthase